MTNWLKQRLWISLWALVCVFFITFLLVRFLPGDPFLSEQALPEASYQELRQHWKLDDVWYVQLYNHAKSVIFFDFGTSIISHDRLVKDIISYAFPVSLQLGLSALILALLMGISSAIIATLWTAAQRCDIYLVLTTCIISMPTFLIGALLQYGLAVELHWFPVARWGSWEQMILPALSLAACPGAFLGRLLYVRLQTEMQEPYARFAEAKGLSTTQIILRHALRNACPPILAYLGPLTANIATGSFVVEKVFAIPGLGYWFVQSVGSRDYPLIVALVMLYCSVLLLCVFLSDIAVAWADPRQRTRIYSTSAI